MRLAACLKSKPGKEIIISVILLIWPMVWLYKYMVPDKYVFSWVIGNDFTMYAKYKYYLLDVLSNFRIPLWSPAEAGGYPFYSSPFTQTFYPLNIPLVIFYKLFPGYTVIDHQRFTILGIGIFTSGLYLWFRSLRIEARAAFFSAAVMGISFKIIEAIRFPNAIHTAAWMPFLLLGCTLAVEEKRRRLGGAIIAIATLMEITAGYPYFLYYTIFLAGPYVILLLIAKTRREFIPLELVNKSGYMRTILISFLIPVIICSPYLYKMKQLLGQTVDRQGHDFAFATAHIFGINDTLGSLIFPPAASAEGWYYFGLLGVFLIGIYLYGSLRQMRTNPRSALFPVVMVGWFLMITYISYGRSSYLFALLWRYLPGFSSLRVWGRINIILIPIIGLLLARAYDYFERLLFAHGQDAAAEIKKEKQAVLLYFLLFLALVLSIQALMYHDRLYSHSWLINIADYNIKFAENYYLLIGAGCGSVILFLLAWNKWPVKTDKARTVLLLALVLLSVYDVGKIGFRQYAYQTGRLPEKTALAVDKRSAQAFMMPRTYSYGTIALGQNYSVGYMENWYYQRYLDFLAKYAVLLTNRQETPRPFAQLMGLRDGKRMYFSDAIAYNSIEPYLQDCANKEKKYIRNYYFHRYNGDNLSITLETTAPGYLSFIDNWDPDWEATVNGEQVKIELLFGTFKAIKINKGTNNIEFSYRPKL